MDACSMPESLLLRVFARCIKQACISSPGRVKKIGVTITSPNLEYPIGIPVRPLHQNTPHALLCTFLKFDQSRTRPSLLGAPVNIAITALCGTDGGYRRKLEVIHNVNESCLIQVSFCTPMTYSSR